MSGAATAPTGRAEVRDLVASIVQAAVEPLGGQVLRARVYPVQLDQLPCVLVYGWSETKTCKSISSADPRYEVTCTMAVRARAAAEGPEELEAALENLAGAITNAVLQAPDLVDDGGAIELIKSVKTDILIPEESARQGETLVGEVAIGLEMQWSETYDVPLPIGQDGPYCTEITFDLEQIPTTKKTAP